MCCMVGGWAGVGARHVTRCPLRREKAAVMDGHKKWALKRYFDTRHKTNIILFWILGEVYPQANEMSKENAAKDSQVDLFKQRI